MTTSSGNSKSSFWDFLRSLFAPKPPSTPPKPPAPADNVTEVAKIVTARVLLVVYDPVMDPASGEKLSRLMNWKRPEDLITGFISDILQTSNGMARYQIVERVDLNEFPTLIDGFCYTPQGYLDVIHKVQPPHTPPMADYQAILARLNILTRIAQGDIDEVWLFAFPHAGFYESTMAGAGAFWCNAPPIAGTDTCPRRFIVMGFSYERGVGEMLESFGHRAESVLEKTFAKTSGEANLYRKFTRYDKESPDQAEVGNIHYAPNSESDYDWGNPRLVDSACDDWYNFPNFQGTTRQVNANEWGNGDIRQHHVWWLKHIPHVAGRTSGVHNNWWQYIMDPNLVIL
ncbi:MAG: hypothetical protein AB1531_02745 [Chloroflexota bacterium]